VLITTAIDSDGCSSSAERQSGGRMLECRVIWFVVGDA